MTAKTDEPEQSVDPQQMFQDLFKTEKYREKISQFSVFGKKTLTVDFQDIYAFNQDLARMLLEKPEEYLRHAAKGAYEQLRIEDPAYAETTDSEEVLINICQMLKAESLRDLSADQLGKLVMVEGIVVRATPTQPLIREAAFKCKACGTITMVPQTTALNPAADDEEVGREVGLPTSIRRSAETRAVPASVFGMKPRTPPRIARTISTELACPDISTTFLPAFSLRRT